MDWLSKLERRFGKYAIPNLMYYIIIMYAGGFILQLINPSFYYQYLSLDASAILHGQIWDSAALNECDFHYFCFVSVLYDRYAVGESMGSFSVQRIFFCRDFVPCPCCNSRISNYRHILAD